MRGTGHVRAIVLAAALVFLVAAAANAQDVQTAKEVESLAARYVAAFEEARFAECRTMCSSFALSWMEYVEALAATPAGSVNVTSGEALEQGDYYLAKVFFTSAKGEPRVRYLKLRKAEGAWSVVDDGRRGREWVSSTYIRGMFTKPDEEDGLKVTVLGILDLPNEFKFDIMVENTTDVEKRVYPQLEAYYTAETTRNPMHKYYALQPANPNPLDGPIGPKSRKFGFLLFPKFTRDFERDPLEKLEGLKWRLHIPYGVIDQLVIFQ